jgi:sugar phosphate isomerase/epimerase
MIHSVIISIYAKNIFTEKRRRSGSGPGERNSCHQQIQGGNLMPNTDLAWEETAYFQVGDNPGRKEPTTGKANFTNVFRHIHEKGYAGIICMEHGNSRPGKEGELALREAYAAVDNFCRTFSLFQG